LRDLGDGDAVVDGYRDVVLLDLELPAEAAVRDQQTGAPITSPSALRTFRTII
jgi:hypothetical protein